MDEAPAPASTVIGCFLELTEEKPSQALWFTKSGGSWQPITRENARAAVTALASGLASLGIRPGERVCLMGPNVPEWLIADYALQHIGAVVVPLYENSPLDQIESVLRQTKARTILAYGEQALGRIRETDMTDVENLVALHADDVRPDDVLSMRDLVSRGEQWTRDDPDGLARLMDAIEPDDIATVIFTSGTSGEPKGVRLTHRNLTWAATAATEAIGANPKEKALSYLPLAHAFERVVTTVVPIVSRDRSWTCWFVPDLKDLPASLKSVRPTIFTAVPAVWSRVKERIISELSDRASPRTEFARRIVARADPLARDTRPLWRRSPFSPLAARFIGRRILKRVGLGRCWFAVSGAAPLPAETQTFFHALGLPLQQGWGLTETAALSTVQKPGDLEAGVVGEPIEGVEIDIGVDGEVLVRGPNVAAGYEGNPSAMTDSRGFFHTGDIGQIDESGRLTILGRKTDILITAGGSNVSPGPIEAMLSADSLITGAVVVGEGRPYLAALIAIDGASAAELAGDASADRVWESEAVRAHIERTVAAVNRSLPEATQIRRFSILPFGFPDDALTPTLKLKRRIVETTFADTIGGLYE